MYLNQIFDHLATVQAVNITLIYSIVTLWWCYVESVSKLKAIVSLKGSFLNSYHDVYLNLAKYFFAWT